MIKEIDVGDISEKGSRTPKSEKSKTLLDFNEEQLDAHSSCSKFNISDSKGKQPKRLKPSTLLLRGRRFTERNINSNTDRNTYRNAIELAEDSSSSASQLGSSSTSSILTDFSMVDYDLNQDQIRPTKTLDFLSILTRTEPAKPGKYLQPTTTRPTRCKTHRDQEEWDEIILES